MEKNLLSEAVRVIREYNENRIHHGMAIDWLVRILENQNAEIEELRARLDKLDARNTQGSNLHCF